MGKLTKILLVKQEYNSIHLCPHSVVAFIKTIAMFIYETFQSGTNKVLNFMEDIAMFLYKSFQTGTSKMVNYDDWLQDTIIMLMDATLSEEDFLALPVYVCGVPVVCPGVPRNDQW